MRKITNQQFIKKVNDCIGNEYHFLEEYIDYHTPILVNHNKCGNVYNVSPANFLKGRRCPYCALKNRLKDKQVFENEFYNLLGDEYTLLSEYQGSDNKILVRHNICGNEYYVRASGILNSKKRCAFCNGKLLKSNDKFLQEIYNLVGDEYTVLGKYINDNTEILFKHNLCGNEFLLKPNSFLFGNRRCPKCKTISKGETEIKNNLDSLKIEYIQQKSFDGLIFKSKLFYDFYLPKLNICIEFDGLQHYKNCFNRTNDEFEEQQIRDEIKNKYCLENNIRLIRIPYWNRAEIPTILNKLKDEYQAAQKGVTQQTVSPTDNNVDDINTNNIKEVKNE